MVDGMWLFAEGAEVYATVLWSCSKETDWKELILEHGWPYCVYSWTVLHLIIICMQSYTKPFPIQHVIVFHVWFILMEDEVLCVWGSLFTGNIKGEMESTVNIHGKFDENACLFN